MRLSSRLIFCTWINLAFNRSRDSVVYSCGGCEVVFMSGTVSIWRAYEGRNNLLTRSLLRAFYSKTSLLLKCYIFTLVEIEILNEKDVVSYHCLLFINLNFTGIELLGFQWSIPNSIYQKKFSYFKILNIESSKYNICVSQWDCEENTSVGIL